MKERSYAFKLGELAGKYGLTKNPYHPNSIDWKDWQRGYYKGVENPEDETPVDPYKKLAEQIYGTATGRTPSQPNIQHNVPKTEMGRKLRKVAELAMGYGKPPKPEPIRFSARDYFKQLHQAGIWERDHYAALERDGWQWHPAGFYWHFWHPGKTIWPG